MQKGQESESWKYGAVLELAKDYETRLCEGTKTLKTQLSPGLTDLG